MMRRRSNHRGPLPFVRHRPTTNPIMPVTAMAEAIEFYERLGFEGRAYDTDYAWISHCGWEWLHLRRVESVDGNASSAYLHIDDADAWREAMIKASNGSIDLSDATAMPWGKKEFSFTDPAGNLIRLGSNL